MPGVQDSIVIFIFYRALTTAIHPAQAWQRYPVFVKGHAYEMAVDLELIDQHRVRPDRQGVFPLQQTL